MEEARVSDRPRIQEPPSDLCERVAEAIAEHLESDTENDRLMESALVMTSLLITEIGAVRAHDREVLAVYAIAEIMESVVESLQDEMG